MNYIELWLAGLSVALAIGAFLLWLRVATQEEVIGYIKRQLGHNPRMDDGELFKQHRELRNEVRAAFTELGLEREPASEARWVKKGQR